MMREAHRMGLVGADIAWYLSGDVLQVDVALN